MLKRYKIAARLLLAASGGLTGSMMTTGSWAAFALCAAATFAMTFAIWPPRRKA